MTGAGVAGVTGEAVSGETGEGVSGATGEGVSGVSGEGVVSGVTGEGVDGVGGVSRAEPGGTNEAGAQATFVVGGWRKVGRRGRRAGRGGGYGQPVANSKGKRW